MDALKTNVDGKIMTVPINNMTIVNIVYITKPLIC